MNKHISRVDTNTTYTYVTKLLFRLGFSPSNKGFNYIREMILNAYEDSIYKMECLYDISSKGDKLMKVAMQTAVRNAIKNAYSLTKFRYLREAINLGDIGEEYLATPRQFISIVLELLRYFWNGDSE